MQRNTNKLEKQFSCHIGTYWYFISNCLKRKINIWYMAISILKSSKDQVVLYRTFSRSNNILWSIAICTPMLLKSLTSKLIIKCGKSDETNKKLFMTTFTFFIGYKINYFMKFASVTVFNVISSINGIY